MDPKQANWQQDGGAYKADITLMCQGDGSFLIESGDFRHETSDPSEVTETFARLAEYGQQQAQGGTTGS